ncbi:MAG TPA: hypothetical protein VIL01_12120 [Thermomicrobiales bacterium]
MPRVDCFLLADAAQVVGGKLYILGGGWERLTVPELPLTRGFEIAVRVIVPWIETNRPLQFTVQLENEDGVPLLDPPARPVVTVGRPVHLREGSEQGVPFVLKISNVELKETGRHVFTLRYEDEVLARTAFDVLVKQRKG